MHPGSLAAPECVPHRRDPCCLLIRYQSACRSEEDPWPRDNRCLVRPALDWKQRNEYGRHFGTLDAASEQSLAHLAAQSAWPDHGRCGGHRHCVGTWLAVARRCRSGPIGAFATDLCGDVSGGSMHGEQGRPGTCLPQGRGVRYAGGATSAANLMRLAGRTLALAQHLGATGRRTALPRRDGVGLRHANHYITAMRRLVRIFALTVTVLGLALAGPVQANCVPPPASSSMLCCDMTKDEAPDDQQRPDAPAKACPIVQCPSAAPTFAEVTAELELPAVLTVRRTIFASSARAGADSAPEYRPPIF